MDVSREILRVLIKMYQERTCLWQTNTDGYRNRALKMKAYQEMVDFLKEHGVPEATDHLVKDKIQSMRRSVRKERDKIVRSNGRHKTRLWYYNAFDFVAGNRASQKAEEESTSTNDNKNAVKQEIEDSDSNESSDTDPLSVDPQEVADDSQEENHNNIVTDQCSVHLEPRSKHFRGLDEFEALGISVAAKVRRMDSRQKIYAELLIQKVLAKGLLGQLNESVEIVDLSCIRKANT